MRSLTRRSLIGNFAESNTIKDSEIYTIGLLKQHKPQCIAYADDVTLTTRSKQEMISTWKQLEQSYCSYINQYKAMYTILKEN